MSKRHPVANICSFADFHIKVGFCFGADFHIGAEPNLMASYYTITKCCPVTNYYFIAEPDIISYANFVVDIGCISDYCFIAYYGVISYYGIISNFYQIPKYYLAAKRKGRAQRDFFSKLDPVAVR